MAKRSPKKKTTKKAKRGTVFCNTLTTKCIFLNDRKGQAFARINGVSGVLRVALGHGRFCSDGIAVGVAGKNDLWVQIVRQEHCPGLGMTVTSDGRRGFNVNGEPVFTVFFVGIGMNRESEIELKNSVNGPIREVVPATADTQPVFQVDVPDVIWEVHGKQTWPLEGYHRPWEK